jgi:phospholipase C
VTPQQHYFISAPDVSKTPYTTLPPPDLNGVPLQASDSHLPPFATVAAAQAAEPSLEPEDAVLLTTGAATGLTFQPEANGVRNPDTRILNVTNLPNGPYQQTAKDAQGHGLAYDAYTEDTIHRFYQMWQQTDCSAQHASPDVAGYESPSISRASAGLAIAAPRLFKMSAAWPTSSALLLASTPLAI